MRKYIVLGLIAISLIACKKNETVEPSKTVTPPITTATTKTISIMCQTACGGSLKVDWDYELNTPIDSVYYYSSLTTITKSVDSDSIRVYFYSSVCTVCSPCASQITLYVNGIVKQSWTNNMGGVYYTFGI